MAGAVKPPCVVGPTSLYAVERPASDPVPDVVAHLQAGDRVGARIENTLLDQARYRQRVPPSGRGILQRLDESQSRSEEHTSELQSRPHLVCRLLLEKKTQPSSE